jgi:hypothetical protein
MMVPIFFQPNFWANMSGRTVFFTNHSNLVSVNDRANLIFHITSNLLYIPFVYLFIPGEANFIVSSLVDPLLAVFLPLGFLLALLSLRRNRFVLFLTVSFLFELFIISFTNPYDAPPLTRMFLFVPFYFVFVAFGLEWLAKIISSITKRPGKVYWLIISCVFVVGGCLNMIQSNLIYQQRVENFPVEPTVLRMFQHDAIDNPAESKVYLFMMDKDTSLFWYQTLQDVYGVPESKAQLLRLVVDSPQLPADWLNRIKDEENLVVILPQSLPESLRVALQPILVQTGKLGCDVTDLPGKSFRFQVWYSPKYQNLCAEALSQN